MADPSEKRWVLQGYPGGVKDREDERKPTLSSLKSMISFKNLAMLRIVLV